MHASEYHSLTWASSGGLLTEKKRGTLSFRTLPVQSRWILSLCFTSLAGENLDSPLFYYHSSHYFQLSQLQFKVPHLVSPRFASPRFVIAASLSPLSLLSTPPPPLHLHLQRDVNPLSALSQLVSPPVPRVLCSVRSTATATAVTRAYPNRVSIVEAHEMRRCSTYQRIGRES